MAEAKKGKDGKEEAPPVAPIIIKKIQGEEAGAHGGAWKIALADMMTAMMAFFLLMWLLGATSEAQRKSIADYFKPTPKSLVQMGQLAGSNGILGGRSILDPEGLPNAASQTSILDLEPPKMPEAQDGQGNGPDRDVGKGPDKDDGEGKGPSKETANATPGAKSAEQQDQENFDKLEQELRKRMQESSLLSSLQGQVTITRDREGLRIEVIDKADFSMFGSGGSRMLPRAQALIDEIAKSVASMPNKVKVTGHTDSVPFTGNQEARNNWTLSAERAEATRQLLERRGVKPERFSGIEGVADTEPFSPDKNDPRNRRISVTLKYQDK